MAKTLYLECNAGISGDMTVAALLDLGASQEVLQEVLKSIPVNGFSVEIGRVKKAGIDCCDFRVILDHEHENHDHDMEYLHGHSRGGHVHGEEMCDHVHGEKAHGHSHEHGHGHGHHHEHRGMAEIREILAACQMTKRARQIGEKIFEILAESEGKAHNVPVEEVHFHEVGAVDSVVDIVSAAVCLDNLGIEEVIVPSLCEGKGTVRCQHGILPIPVPAVANILSAYRIRTELLDAKGEFVTPTGAAIVAAVRTGDRLPGEFTIRKVGMGAGKRSYECPSILRAMIIEKAVDEKETFQRDTIYKLETNIDDSTGEMLGYVMEKLLEAGARDVHYMPVYMKKNRPAWQLNVICTREAIERMEQIIFSETTTIGIRRSEMERSVLAREQITVETPYGKATVKVCRSSRGERRYPEYDSVVAICKESGLSFGEAYELVKEAGIIKR